MKVLLILASLTLFAFLNPKHTISKIRTLREDNLNRYRNERRLDVDDAVEPMALDHNDMEGMETFPDSLDSDDKMDSAQGEVDAEKRGLTNQIAVKELDIRELTNSISVLHNSIDDFSDNFMTQVAEISNVINLDA